MSIQDRCCSNCNYSPMSNPGYINCHYKHLLNYECAREAIKKNSCFVCLDLGEALKDKATKNPQEINEENLEFFIRGKKCSEWVSLKKPGVSSPPLKKLTLPILANNSPLKVFESVRSPISYFRVPQLAKENIPTRTSSRAPQIAKENKPTITSWLLKKITSVSFYLLIGITALFYIYKN